MTELTKTDTVQNTDKQAERIRQARLNAGLSQYAAAEKLGVGQSRVSNYENKINKRIPPEFIRMCAKAYNCSLEYLYGFSDDITGGYTYRPIKKDSVIAVNRNALSSWGLDLSDLDEVIVSDQAMQDTFTKGTEIIITKKIGDISKPAIYAIEQDGQLLMRGIRKELSGNYTLFVQNKHAYDDQTLSENELKNLNIIGKYIGHWQLASI